MIVIRNGIIPFKGFSAMLFFGILFVRNDNKRELSATDFNHESIHARQCLEMLGVFFYLLYVIEWLVRVPLCGFKLKDAYRSISFEREAYGNEKNLTYISTRKAWSWVGYLITSKS